MGTSKDTPTQDHDFPVLSLLYLLATRLGRLVRARVPAINEAGDDDDDHALSV